MRSRAAATRSPDDRDFFTAPCRFFGPGWGGLKGTRIGLLASSSIRSETSWMDSVPVHGAAAAISWVPLPAMACSSHYIFRI